MRIPTATYRLQLRPTFGFEAAQSLIPYLVELGISDIYASPVLQARQGSTHGYDVVDPTRLNLELGTIESFEALIQTIQQHHMGWIQDIVPNHMAYDSENAFLMDVLEYGPNSEYFNYFDIEWEHPYEDTKGRVLTPLLGDFYGSCLERGEIQLEYGSTGFTVNYYSLKLPLRIESYADLLTYDLEDLSQSLDRNHPDFIKLLGIFYIIKNIPADAIGQQRKEQASFAKSLLWELYNNNPKIKQFIHRNLDIFNGEPGKSDSFNLLDNLLGKQFFRLSFWKVGAEELNYRRFFTINELICMRVEDPEVFASTHSCIQAMAEAKQITGLRIDHIDGLYYPKEYLHRLREAVGDLYILVEKILDLGRDYFAGAEELSNDWEIQGTTGYDFLNCVNSLFCQKENQRRFNEIYAQITGFDMPYEELIIERKRLIADKNLAGDLENLANFLKRLAGQHRYGRDFTLNGLRKAILEVLILFPVYRTYISPDGVGDRDRLYVQETLQHARQRIPILANEFNFLERLLLLDYDESLTQTEREQWLHFVMRFQQISGPLTAKGVEDTFLYVYNRLISLNEVGSSPYQFGISLSAFHYFNQRRREHFPQSMNATATHDTKRGEDMRARLNVLSEIPDQWEAEVLTWIEQNQRHKTKLGDATVPDSNDEYFLYQTLVGALPVSGQADDTFCDRIKAYVIKAVREAKIHTAWLRPDSRYEEGFIQFVDRILAPSDANPFPNQLRSFQQQIAYYGMFNSLAQVLLKIAAPGVPDFYQGTELWDFSLVDPDNRRPVDFQQRRQFLQQINQRMNQDSLDFITELHQTWDDGRIKLFLMMRALAARQQLTEVFQSGDYIPLEVMGIYHNHLLAFVRRYGQQAAIAIVPRFLTSLIKPGEFPLGTAVWQDTQIDIPEWLLCDWQNAITNQSIPYTPTLKIGHMLEHFPVALLISQPIPSVNETGK